MTEEEMDERLKTGMLAGRQWLIDQAQKRQQHKPTEETYLPQTIAEIYEERWIPSLRLYRFILEMAQRHPQILETDGQYLDNIGKLYRDEAIELDTAQETTR